jgi:hypothetical protein
VEVSQRVRLVDCGVLVCDMPDIGIVYHEQGFESKRFQLERDEMSRSGAGDSATPSGVDVCVRRCPVVSLRFTTEVVAGNNGGRKGGRAGCFLSALRVDFARYGAAHSCASPGLVHFWVLPVAFATG